MTPSITIIVPTLGRPTLHATLGSFAESLTDEDQVVVVADGALRSVREIVEDFDFHYNGEWIYHWRADFPAGNWGHPLRNNILNWGIQTDYVWTIDDDDAAAPGALDALRSAEGPWTIFRMQFGPGHPANGITCWREPYLRYGDIGTPMILARPCAARFGNRYEGDWDYAQELQAEYGDPAWDERVIALIRP